MTFSNAKRIIKIALLVWGVAPRSAFAQPPVVAPDSIAARIVGTLGSPIRNATVHVTSFPKMQTREATSDSLGRVLVVMSPRDERYLVVVEHHDFATARRTVGAPESTHYVYIEVRLDAILAPSLAVVKVTATRPRAPRTLGFDGPVAAADIANPQIDMIKGMVSPGDERSVGNLVNATVGIFDGNGLGAFGLSPENTTVTLNGMNSSGRLTLPTGLATSVQVNTTTATGGFAGANVNVDVLRGSAYHFARTTAFYDGSALAFGGDPARAIGANINSYVLALSGQGPIGASPWRYNGAFDAARASSTNATLATSSKSTLAAFGLSMDSVARLVSTLPSLGFSHLDNGPDIRSRQSMSGLIRLDRIPVDNSRQSSARSWTVIASAQVDDNDPLSNVRSLWSTGISSTKVESQLIARMSQYVGTGRAVLSETQFALTVSKSASRPLLEIPLARIRLTSTIDSATVTRDLQVGGDGSGDASALSKGAELRHLFAWKIADSKLDNVTLQLFGRVQQGHERLAPNSQGQFEFESLDTFERGEALRYRRTLTVNEWNGTYMTGGAAMSAVYWPQRRLVLRPTLRLVGDRFSQYAGSANEIDAEFNVRSTYLPRSFSVIPHLGFSYFDVKTSNLVQGVNTINSFVPVIEGPAWAFPSVNRSWQGSIGQQRGFLPSNFTSTIGEGTADHVPIEIDCDYASAPPVDWAAWTANASLIPRTCRDNTGTTNDERRSIRTLGRGFSAPSVWVVSVVRNRPAPALGLNFTFSAQQRFTHGLPTSSDRNLRASPAFLDSEARAVFANIQDINPETGTAAFATTRIDGAYGRVTEVRNNGTSRLTLLGTQIMPRWEVQSKHHMAVILNYVWQRGTQLTDGLARPTFDDPRTLRRSMLPVAAHQFGLQVGKQIGKVVISGQLQLVSGANFTPIVGRDVNADGYLNDAARIPAPGVLAGSVNVTDYNALLARVPAAVRSCLEKHSGEIAMANSCPTPWTVRSNARLQLLNPMTFANRELAISLNFANLAAGVDGILHGGNTLRGWGGTRSPDPVLLNVRGFSPAGRQFQYDVNPRFGQSDSRRTGYLTPFRMSINFSLDIAQPIPVQELHDAISVRRNGVRTRASVAAVATRLRQAYVRDPYDFMRDLDDSLQLTSVQDSVLQLYSLRFTEHSGVRIETLASQLTALPDRFDGRKALALRDQAVIEISLLADQHWILIDDVLTAAQFKRMPDSAREAIRRVRAQGTPPGAL